MQPVQINIAAMVDGACCCGEEPGCRYHQKRKWLPNANTAAKYEAIKHF
jgi:hypothetical protein